MLAHLFHDHQDSNKHHAIHISSCHNSFPTTLSTNCFESKCNVTLDLEANNASRSVLETITGEPLGLHDAGEGHAARTGLDGTFVDGFLSPSMRRMTMLVVDSGYLVAVG